MWRLFPFLLSLTLLSGTAFAQSQNPGCVGDLDGNFAVDLDDLMMILTLYGSACEPLPEDPEVSTGTLIITEIMYNPASEQGNDSDFEFLELHNPDTMDAHIGGWKLMNAVSYTFADTVVVPAGGFVAVVRNVEAMDTLVPPSGLLIQWNSGESLNNTGETIELWRADGTLSDEVPYEDNDGWISQPDGGGPSLELIDIALDNSLPDAWTFSSGIGGTPGAPNSMWALNDPE